MDKETKQTKYKTFLWGFLGAALACVLAFGINSAFFQNSSSSVVLGGDGSGTTITVQGEDATLAEVVAQKTLPSVVNINVYTQGSSSPWDMVANEEAEYTESSLGSGVILTADGYILTNYHVIEGADKLEVIASGDEYDAKVVGTDASSDLAVLKVEASSLVPIEIGSSADLVVGEWVMAAGSPFGLEQSVSTGIVSAVSRSSALTDADSTTVYTNMIQTDAAINPGNSGGALVDKDGKLIGINTLIASSSGTSSGVGFAIPVDYAMSIAEQIMKGEDPSHAQMGVSLTTINSAIAERYGLSVNKGAYVTQVYSDSGAAKAGLEAGDIITKIDDQVISSGSDVIIAVRSHNIGDTLKVTYMRNGEERTADVTLGSDR